jgi:ribosomal protein S18 acetylase RimI-like enzyme
VDGLSAVRPERGWDIHDAPPLDSAKPPGLAMTDPTRRKRRSIPNPDSESARRSPTPRPENPPALASPAERGGEEAQLRVRRIHRRDLNRVWEFLKRTFRDVNRETVEYQRPRLKRHFLEVYDDEAVEQLLFELVRGRQVEIVGYAECAFEIAGSDNWMNEAYFERREMRPLFVDELAVHPDHQGVGIGSFIIEQFEHLARIRGCTHLVLEVAENNSKALRFYRSRNFYKLDAAIFLAKKISSEAELLPPRKLRKLTVPPPQRR